MWGQVPLPIARLDAAIKTVSEFVVDASVGVEAVWATAVLKNAADGVENPSSKWIFRPDRTSIKNDAQALVLFPTAASATKDSEDKKNAKDKIKRRRVRAAFAPAAAKAAAEAKVACAVAVAKTFRGRGVSLERFACTIANFV